MKESRINEMADYIGKHITVSLTDLADVFQVSIFTIRRDIDILEERGIVTKRYGGVTINKKSNTLLAFDDRNTLNKPQKQAICQKAAEFITPGDIIFIDGGTTTQYIPDYMEDIPVTVITNNVYVIPKLLPKRNVKLVILGGEVDRRTNSISGIDTVDFLRNRNITKAFLACTGVNESFNLTNYTVVEAELKRQCITNSTESYLLADHTKFGVSSLVTYGHISQLTAIITDATLIGPYKTYCEDKKVACYHV